MRATKQNFQIGSETRRQNICLQMEKDISFLQESNVWIEMLRGSIATAICTHFIPQKISILSCWASDVHFEKVARALRATTCSTREDDHSRA